MYKEKGGKSENVDIDAVTVSAEVTEKFVAVPEEYLGTGAFLTKPDSIRDAICQKLQREAPHIYRKKFEVSRSD